MTRRSALAVAAPASASTPIACGGAGDDTTAAPAARQTSDPATQCSEASPGRTLTAQEPVGRMGRPEEIAAPQQTYSFMPGF